MILIDTRADEKVLDAEQTKTNNDMLIEIYDWVKRLGYLNTLYEIVYTHPIDTDEKDLSSFLIFTPPGSMCEFILVTSMWNRLPLEKWRDSGEEELIESFRKRVHRSKAMYARLSGKEIGSTVIEKIIFGRTYAWESQNPLTFQQENLG